MTGSEHKREVLGTGPFTTVSAEWDPLLGQAVAIKELNHPFAGNRAFVRAFYARAQRLFDLDDGHVLAIHRIETGRPAIVRELAEETLEASLLAAPISPAGAEEILREALLGLQALHNRGVAHGAVKPQNLFRCGGRVKIGDFGMTAAVPAPPAPADRYAAPELLRGEAARPDSDLYSLGLILYELLLGKARFEALAAGDLPPLDELVPGVSKTTSVALRAMTRKSVAERPANAGQVLAFLAPPGSPEIRSSIPAPVSTSALDALLRPPAAAPAFDVQKVKRILAISFAVLFGALVVTGILYLWNQRPSEGRAKVARATSAQAAGQDPAPAEALTSSMEDLPEPTSASPATLEAPSTLDERTPKQAFQVAETPASRENENPPVVEEASPTPETPSLPAASAPAPRPSAREMIQGLQPSQYRLGSIHSGKKPYVDLDAVFVDVPGRHNDLPCIKTANGNWSSKESLSFELSRDARVYIGHDRSIKRKPGWLQAFQNSGDTWSVQMRNGDGSAGEVKVFDVFARSYSAGTVSLGPNMGSEIFRLGRQFGGETPSMYLVCVDPR